MAQNYVITSKVQGSGKTTTALNLALCFMSMGKKVQLIFLDQNRGLQSLLKAYKNDNPLFQVSSISSIRHVSLEGFDVNLLELSALMENELKTVKEKDFRAIIPVECEYYAMGDLQKSIGSLSELGVTIEGVLPVMVRGSRTSMAIRDILKEKLKTNLFEAFIQRNFYLARQFDYDSFSLQAFTEKAGITYLNLAVELIERELRINEQ